MSEQRSPSRFELLEEFYLLQRVGARAVAQAQEDSRKLGVPNVYSYRGRIYYELPNGELSLVDPLAAGLDET